VDARLRTLATLRSATVHELRGAANTLALHLQLLQSEIARTDSTRLERSLTVLDDERRRLLAIAEAFIGHATIPDEGASAFDLGAIVGAAMRLARPYAAQRYVRLVAQEPLPSVQVMGRRDAVSQALVDLLLALIERTARQGEIAADLGVDDGTARVRLHPSQTTGVWNSDVVASVGSGMEWAGGRLDAGDTEAVVELPVSHREA
jgi:signal transduction histidine kinase